MADNFARPYLIEQLQALLEHRLITGYYPRRNARLQSAIRIQGLRRALPRPGGTALVAEGDWIVP